MWTRVLTWDEKWLYLVTHFVEGGKVKPRWYLLQPWKKPHSQAAPPVDSSKAHAAVFATSVARYVLKRGRVPIPPEAVLASADLLPMRPMNHSQVKILPVDSATRRDATVRSSAVDAHIDSRPDVWDWERVETTRIEGMKFAKLIAGLDDAHMEFTGPMSPALGHY